MARREDCLLWCRSNYSLTALSSVTAFITLTITSLLMDSEGLSTQTWALGNHKATGTLFAVTAQQLLDWYGFSIFPLSGKQNQRCLDFHSQKREDSLQKTLVFTLGNKQNRAEQPFHFHLKRSPNFKISLPTLGQEAYSRPSCLGPRLEAQDSGSCWCFCCCSVAKPCPILCNPMDCSTPGSSVLCHFWEFAQIHGYWVGDAIKPPAPAFSEYQLLTTHKSSGPNGY